MAPGIYNNVLVLLSLFSCSVAQLFDLVEAGDMEALSEAVGPEAMQWFLEELRRETQGQEQDEEEEQAAVVRGERAVCVHGRAKDTRTDARWRDPCAMVQGRGGGMAAWGCVRPRALCIDLHNSSPPCNR